MSKDVKILHGEIRTPPLSQKARLEVGYLLRQLQDGENLSLPHSRPMPSIGNGYHELRLPDAAANWRVVYFVDTLNIVVLDVFSKKTEQTPQSVVDMCRTRLANYLTEKLSQAKKDSESSAKRTARKSRE